MKLPNKIDVIITITGHIPWRESFGTYDRMIHFIKKVSDSSLKLFLFCEKSFHVCVTYLRIAHKNLSHTTS